MRLTCTRCGKVYVVDEGLRGRAFRLRCKRCDAVIAVAAGAVEAPAEPAPATDPGPAQARAVAASSPGDADFADFSRELQDFADELEREGSVPPPAPGSTQAQPAAPPARPVAPLTESPPILPAGDRAASPVNQRSPALLVAALVAISAAGTVAWHLASPSRSAVPAAAPVAPVAATPTAPAPPDPAPAEPAPPAVPPTAAAPTAAGSAVTAPTVGQPVPEAAPGPPAPKAERKRADAGKPAHVASSAPAAPAPRPAPSAPGVTTPGVAAPARAAQPSPVASPRPDLPPRDPQEAQAALAARAGSFDGCVAEALRDEPGLLATPRPVVLTVTVRPNGRTAYPTLDDAQLTGTALGACVKRQAAALLFPESGGEALRVRTSLLLGR